MLVAKNKRKESIGEYLLYMFQIEDLLRACQLNPQLIEERLIAQYQTDENTKFEIRNWYLGLAELMEEERLHTKGHLNILKHLMTEVYDFHLYLLNNENHSDYQSIYRKNISIIESLKKNSDAIQKNEVELIINLIYSIFVTKLKNQDVPEPVQQSAIQISGLLAQLSRKFSEYEKGLLKID